MPICWKKNGKFIFSHLPDFERQKKKTKTLVSFFYRKFYNSKDWTNKNNLKRNSNIFWPQSQIYKVEKKFRLPWPWLQWPWKLGRMENFFRCLSLKSSEIFFPQNYLFWGGYTYDMHFTFWTLKKEALFLEFNNNFFAQLWIALDVFTCN